MLAIKLYSWAAMSFPRKRRFSIVIAVPDQAYRLLSPTCKIAQMRLKLKRTSGKVGFLSCTRTTSERSTSFLIGPSWILMCSLAWTTSEIAEDTAQIYSRTSKSREGHRVGSGGFGVEHKARVKACISSYLRTAFASTPIGRTQLSVAYAGPTHTGTVQFRKFEMLCCVCAARDGTCLCYCGAWHEKSIKIAESNAGMHFAGC